MKSDYTWSHKSQCYIHNRTVPKFLEIHSTNNKSGTRKSPNNMQTSRHKQFHFSQTHTNRTRPSINKILIPFPNLLRPSQQKWKTFYNHTYKNRLRLKQTCISESNLPLSSINLRPTLRSKFLFQNILLTPARGCFSTPIQ